jgi:replication-associated recombination protein RarA
MVATNQTSALDNLKLLAEHNQHGIVLSGISGCGKTHLAKQYADMLKIPNFYIANPVMSELKSVIDICRSSKDPLVLCIENLDTGVIQTSYPLLKLIEDCPSYIYVVVTCNNIYRIPNTILSRCALVMISPPSKSDLEQYATIKNLKLFENLKGRQIWQCVKGYKDVDTLFNLTDAQISYFDSLNSILKFNSTISNLTWKLQHYEDNSETPIILVLRYILSLANNQHLRASCISCLNDLESKMISQNAIITKFVMENKYCE